MATLKGGFMIYALWAARDMTTKMRRSIAAAMTIINIAIETRQPG
jgi:hypothetical protein